MRRTLLLAALSVSAACFRLPPLVPSNAGQVVEGDPRSGTAEAAGVRFTAHPGDWRGYPPDLDDYVTPVELHVENGSDKEIAVGHPLFSLRVPDGFRYEALSPAELRRTLGPAGYSGGPAGYWYYGAYGVYPWPGLHMPWRYSYPYLWWGDPWFGPFPLPPALPPPPPVAATPKGTLAPGGRVSILVFFPIPANQLGRFTFEANVVGADGAALGRIELPFERRATPPP